MIQITAVELDLLKSALRMSREAMGEACGVSEFAPGRWRQSEAMPKMHFLTFARILAHRSLGPIEFNSSQNQAAKLIEAKLGLPIAILAAEGTASIEAAKNSIFPNDLKGSPYVPRELTDQTTQFLQSLPLEALINEIGRRGFSVQLEPRTIVIK